MNKDNKKILIVGGVAGGASCAARARRLSESAEITIFERGPYVSFANCGLPYYIGNIIKNDDDLIVASKEMFKKRFNINVKTNNEVISIDRANKEIVVKDTVSSNTYTEKYDELVLSPGATPIRPNISGIDLPGIFTVRTIPDSNKVKEWIVKKGVKDAIIVGGGFIGLEMAENLLTKGISVSIVEMLPQLMPPFDPEMVTPLHNHLRSKGISLYLNDPVALFEEAEDDKISVITKTGKSYAADMVILSIGVRPEVKLARDAGLEIGDLGGIRVDNKMRTSDKHIWAIGDAIEVKDFVTGRWTLVPLAGPANREGRLVADAIFGRDVKFRGVQGTSVVGVLGMTLASTGTSEKTLKRINESREEIPYRKVYVNAPNHASYYPGAKEMLIKLLFSPDDGKILGAQAIGFDGVEKRIDVISMAIQKRATVYDLEDAELCYAPPYGAAKDAVNLAGMVAANMLRGDSPTVHWDEVSKTDAFILDARTKREFEAGHINRAINIPLDELRGRLDELPKDKEIWVYCKAGKRSYFATRILRANGYDAINISGGYDMYKNFEPFI
ncbi:MAG TPA: FAD-dependent oxidoreductase [Halobacteria archaeon]|nr:FAD-dependent oxidoreductase [Halobacteria archaeon]